MVSVLHVLLTILKILGIAILVVLGLVLALLILVLFVPVRYKAKGSFEGKNVDVGANVSWLFKFVHLKVGYKYSEPFCIKLKVLGIPIFDNQKEKKPKKVKNNKNSKEEVKIDKDDKRDDETVKNVQNKAENSDNIGESESKVLIGNDEKNIEDDIEKNIEEKKPGIFSKIAGVFKNIKFTFERICDTIRKIRDNIEYYIKLLNLESTKAAFELCKKQIFKLLKLLCPRKYHVNLHIGFDDPSTMGEVMAVYGMLYPWHMGKVEILPEYDVAVMEGNFYVKGRICIVSVIKAACIIYFDKNVKLFIKHLKRRNNINREE
jgi:hypothetical protein